MPGACSTWSVEWSSPNRSPSIASSPRRTPWQSAPGATSTCAESTGKPLVSVQTCRSCTSRTSGSATIACATSSGSMSPGDASRKMRVDSRMQPVRRPEHQRSDDQACDRVGAVPAGEQHDQAGDRGADEREQVGGHVQERAAHVQALPARAREQRRSRPGSRRSPPARRPARCRPGRRPAKPAGESPRTRSRCPRARASGRSPAPRGSPAGGIRTSIAPAPAARRGWRRRPRSRARATSETRCPASASSASDPATMPVTISPTMSAAISARAATRSFRSPSRRWSWSCACIPDRLTRRPESASKLPK